MHDELTLRLLGRLESAEYGNALEPDDSLRHFESKGPGWARMAWRAVELHRAFSTGTTAEQGAAKKLATLAVEHQVVVGRIAFPGEMERLDPEEFTHYGVAVGIIERVAGERGLTALQGLAECWFDLLAAAVEELKAAAKLNGLGSPAPEVPTSAAAELYAMGAGPEPEPAHPVVAAMARDVDADIKALTDENAKAKRRGKAGE